MPKVIKTRGAIGRAIGEFESTGRPHKQAVAIALDIARRSGMKIPKKKKEMQA